MPYKDPEKRRKYQRENWRKYQNPAKKAARVKARNQRNSEWFRQYKATLCCERCGENHPACLDFHHVDPETKEGTMYQLIFLGWSIASLMKEIAKCIVLCANCHRKHHWNEKQGIS